MSETLIDEIKQLQKEKNAVILAHNYQLPEIQDIADFTGDSLELARKAKEVEAAQMIVFCGVRFMAETAKILNPGKKVLLPAPDAGCPLADMAKVEDVVEMKKKYLGAFVVSYVNTSAQVKAVSDVCCTSSNAPAVVRNVPSDTVIFLPDKNLGYFVQKQVPEKKLIVWDGYCFVHRQFTFADLKKARELYPDSEILVHPECNPEIQENADFVLSTSGMLKRAKVSQAKTIIIGTEEGLLHKLKKENPEKQFFSLGPARICVNMKKTTLEKLKNCLENEDNEIILEDEIMKKARNALERMIEYV
ncbi:MAG TPA: quinolinate synthase NadA [bacterium]|nr:quinolinate synthase NadA [bacterium]HOL34450.1 quinolinate synthase NadA [bacterium]HPP08275.1 quinolinate synthase NadA [bacterium]